jgi:hypothetical protein
MGLYLHTLRDGLASFFNTSTLRAHLFLAECDVALRFFFLGISLPSILTLGCRMGFLFSFQIFTSSPCMQIGISAEYPNDLCETSSHNLPRHVHYCSPASSARMNQDPKQRFGMCDPHHLLIAAAPQLPPCEGGVGILMGPSAPFGRGSALAN